MYSYHQNLNSSNCILPETIYVCILLYTPMFTPQIHFCHFSGHDYSCLATVEGIELSEEELRGDLVPCGKSEKFRKKFK